jgi:hypothetical protein
VPRRPALAFPLLLALCSCAPSARWGGSQPPALAFDASRIAEDVAWLADDAREGRGLGSAGLAAAAERIAEGFREAGFEPAFPGGDYLQRFEMPVRIGVGNARLEAGGVRLRRGADYEALLASADGEAAGEVVFVGYGVSAPDLGWDDYAGVDVAGRIALVLEDRPAAEASPLAGAAGAPHVSRAAKLLQAKRHGAVAVLLTPAAAEPAGVLAGSAGSESGNPMIQASQAIAVGLSRRAAEAIVSRARGASLAALQAEIERSVRPASRALRGVRARLAVRIDRELGRVANVVALRRGSDPRLAREAVVVGAHYDHLGRGEFASLAPDRRGEVHNGADDNASGAAGLVALARAFAAAPPTRRTLVLAAFTGEEAGLAGSAEYVRSPAWPLVDTVAMLNLDMIGRLREDQLTVFGVASSPDFRPLVEAATAGLGLAARFEEDGFGPSDQTSFYARGVPVLAFFTGIHPQYHTPDDDASGVDAAGEARVLGLVGRIAGALLDTRTRPLAPPPPAAPPQREAGRGYGPYLGTIPAFGGPPVRGVRLQGVRPGSPAEAAGLRAGDVIVELDGTPIASLEEMSAVLFAAHPGKRVEIVVVREGATRLRLPATLGQRR